MPYLISITENDYREYRKNVSKIEYSFARKGEIFPVPMKQIREATNITILKKWEFLQVMKDPKYAFYLYKNDEGETIGITFLKFTGKTCTIAEFSVFEHLKGLGTKLYEEVANLCRERGVYELVLWCPFNGSKEFWKKMGFYEKSDSFFYKRISKR